MGLASGVAVCLGVWVCVVSGASCELGVTRAHTDSDGEVGWIYTRKGGRGRNDIRSPQKPDKRRRGALVWCLGRPSQRAKSPSASSNAWPSHAVQHSGELGRGVLRAPGGARKGGGYEVRPMGVEWTVGPHRCGRTEKRRVWPAVVFASSTPLVWSLFLPRGTGSPVFFFANRRFVSTEELD
ncbi:hypothetical protein EDB80DRAFT_699576, partial [Ilyonectria destructans]